MFGVDYNNRITIIADASFCSDTKAAGYGIWVTGSYGKKALQGPLPKTLSSNSAELMALANGLWCAAKEGILRPCFKVLMQTDSDHAIRVLRGITEPGDVQQITAKEYINKIKREFKLSIEYRHVKGHTSTADKRSSAQSKCDIAAKSEMLKMRKSILAKRRPGGTGYLRQNTRN